jgi:hypothetical protein
MMRTKIMKGTSAVLTADKESDSQWWKIMAARPTRTAVAEECHTRRRLHVTSACHRHPLRRAGLLLCRRRPHRGYKTFDGLAFPTRRRVYRRNRDGTPDRILAAITIDIDDITTA